MHFKGICGGDGKETLQNIVMLQISIYNHGLTSICWRPLA